MFSWIPRCVDCDHVLWPWQPTGVDWQSHESCHKQRVDRWFRAWHDEKLQIDRMVENMIGSMARNQQKDS